MNLDVLLDVLRWLIALEVVSFAALPLAELLFPAWLDRGYALSKMLGLVLVGYVAWATGLLGFTGFTGPTIVILTAGLALGARLLPRSRATPAAVGRRIRLGEEAVFVLVFLGAVAVRATSPAIAGQEKQMDLTFLQSLIRSDRLPAQDAWLAGSGLPYYYFGYLLQALPAKALAIDPAVAYNLAVASVLALSAVGVFGLVTNLLTGAGSSLRAAGAWGAGGAVALTVMGNLQAFAELAFNQGWGGRAFWTGLGIKNLSAAATGGWFPSDGAWWFRAARVIPNLEPDGITEFPFFSFLLADLHPHYMALPLAVLILGLAIHQLSESGSSPETATRPSRLLPVGIAAVALGSVIPTNTWDVPVLWGAYAAGAVGGAVSSAGFDRRALQAFKEAAARLGAVVVLALLLFGPYFVGYASQPLGLGVVGERTPVGSLVVLFGPLLVLPAVAGLVQLVAGRARLSARSRAPFVVCGVASISLVILRETTLGMLVALLAIWSQILWERLRDGAAAVALATAGLVLLGLTAILVPELVFLRDVFGSRMNTVFKFYYDAWIVLAIALPLVAWELVEWARSSRPNAQVGVRWGSIGGLVSGAVLILAGMLYPLGAIPARAQFFGPVPSLDGMAHLRAFRPDDAAAIDWLRAQSPGIGVVEAVGDDYSDAGRFATFGGAVIPIGWVGHELQWRGPRPELEGRRDLVRRVYTERFDETVRRSLLRLGMDFIAVGSLERQLYGAGVDTRFDLEPAYQGGSTTLYRLAAGSRA